MEKAARKRRTEPMNASLPDEPPRPWLLFMESDPKVGLHNVTNSSDEDLEKTFRNI